MSEGFFIYHSTAVEEIPEILEEGLRPSEENHRGRMETDFQTMADEKDISLPVKRQKCVFCYPSLRQAITMTTFDTGPPGSLHTMAPREGVLTIDAASLRENLYVADFKFFSEVIDLTYMDEPDAIIQSESYEAALTNYAESVTPFETFNSVAEMNDEFLIPELLIETDILPSNIHEILLCKDILGTGWFSSYPALPVWE